MLTKEQDEILINKLRDIQIELVEKFEAMCKLAMEAGSNDPILIPFWKSTWIMMGGFKGMLGNVMEKHRQ